MAQLTYREALRDGMSEELRRDKNVFLMGEEVAEYQGAYKCSQGMLEEFGPSRIVDTPIAEAGFTGLACGAAMKGMRPIVEYMTWNFAMLAIDHIVNTAAKTLYMSGGEVSFPMVFRGLNGVAARVGAQHTQDFASWYGSVPGLKVIAPATPSDIKGMIKSAIRDNAPVVCLENERLYGEVGEVPKDKNHLVPIGKAAITREGKDVTLISYSITANRCLEAAEELSKLGIEAEVIDLRTIRPLDVETLVKSVKKTHRAVTVSEGWSYAGIGAEVATVLMENAFDYLDAPVTRVTVADIPMPYAHSLEQLTLPQVQDIVTAAKEVCYK
jgi:pyruvate dehydrogenase E1 component beta subunit